MASDSLTGRMWGEQGGVKGGLWVPWVLWEMTVGVQEFLTKSDDHAILSVFRSQTKGVPKVRIMARKKKRMTNAMKSRIFHQSCFLIRQSEKLLPPCQS